MNRDQIYEELARLTALADGWRKAAEVPAIERDLMLSRLRGLYGALMFETPASPSSELTAAAAVAVAAAEEDANEAIDIMLDEFDEPDDAAAESAAESSVDTAPTGDEPADTEENAEEDAEEEHLPEIEVEIVTDFESAFADETAESEADDEPFTETVQAETELPAADESEGETEPAVAEEFPEPSEPELGIETETDIEADTEAEAEDETVSEYDEPEFSVEEEPAPADEPDETTEKTDEPEFEIEPAPADEPEFIVETEPVAEPDETESESVSETAAPEFIVETAATAEPSVQRDEPAAEHSSEQQPATPQSNLFGFEAVAAPRRQRHRIISLYDDDLFERIPDRKADKPSQTDDEPQFEVVTPSEPAVIPEPQPAADDSEITVMAAGDAFAAAPDTAAGHVDIPAATFIVDADPEPAAAVEDFRIEVTDSTVAEPAKVVLGDILGSDRRTLADSMATQHTTTADALAHTPVTDLAGALSIGDRYRIESELFGGDAERCRRTLATLDGMESLDDAVIYIEENFSWHPSSEAACLVMELLERKFS